jgi:hypothetical protein
MGDTKDPDQKINRKNEGSAADIVGKLVSLTSVLILAGTFIFSVYQYRSQQRDLLKHEQVDQIIKIQSQMRNDTDGISQFPKNKNMTISGGEFLIRDLDSLLQSRIDVDASKSESVQADRRKITKILYNLVYQDCNFDEQRDVEFSIMVLDSWDDYKGYLKSDPELIWDLLAVNYLDAITALREKAPQYISQLKYNKERAEFEPPKLVKPADESHFRHFEDLVRGFNKHLDLLDAGSEQRKELIKRFQAATCNKDLTQARFGWSVDPKMYPDWFGPCS